MKVTEIPVNTIVELKFYYMGIRHKIKIGLLYQYGNTVYISALKSGGKTVPAARLQSVNLIYHTELGVYTFHNVSLRSLSLNGQKLYAVQSESDAQIVNNRKAYRLYIGANVSAKIITDRNNDDLQCILKDISATGMGILSHKKIDETAKIEISFRLNNQKEILIGRIVRVDEFKNGTGYLYGCEFEEPNDTIAKYVSRQIEKLKNQSDDMSMQSSYY